MKRPATSAQIAAALKQEELGMPLEDVIRQAGVSKQTFLSWKEQYGALSHFPSDLQHLQEENEMLKQMVGKLTLENARLSKLNKLK
jgi:putative transposase